MSGFSQSTSMSRPPVSLFTNSVFFQRLAAVGGLEDAALVVRAERRAERRQPHRVGVERVHLDAADLPGVLQAHQLPLLAGVGRLVDAAADDHVRADGGAAGADPHVIGVRGRDVDRSDRAGRDLPVAHRHPRNARIVGLPDAAADAAEVEGVGLLAHAGIGGDAPAARGADAAPLQVLVGVQRNDLVGVTLGGDARRRAGGEDQGRQRDRADRTDKFRILHGATSAANGDNSDGKV